MAICKQAEDAFVQQRYAREQALALAAQTPNAVEDVGGLYVNSALIIKTTDPQALLAAATVRRQTTLWKPPHATLTPAEFVNIIDSDLTSIADLVKALNFLLKTTDQELADRITQRLTFSD